MISNEAILSLVNNFNENKLAHVFLVETNDKEAALKDLLEFIKLINCENTYQKDCKKCNMCHLISHHLLPSLKVIFPDHGVIKKEQMENLKHFFLTLPTYSKYNVYIINDAEKFNSSSANTMLKFMEEPEKNILGFLITNNKENVISTIKSRCSLIKANYTQAEFKIEERLKELAIRYLLCVEVEKQKSIVYNKIILEEKLEKQELVFFFQFLLDIYEQAFKGNLKIGELQALNNLSKEIFLKRIKLIAEVIERLSYNVNLHLLLDSFVLEMED